MNKKFEERTGRAGRAVAALCRARRSTWVMRRLSRSSDRGMTTSEYAVGTIAACAFAAVLYKVVNSGPVMSALQSMIENALDAQF
ncbi:DUF4244 domain-containing protein [Streptomyces sp. bgisy029]|uniref:DUF4244 domain-containing protein n=1 Tax=Streptomyces sp. bgisy029 TaxID=3413771 RepID=UPI003D703CB5